MRNSTCRLIRSFGIRAEAFGSAREFLDSGRVESSACLILDVRMPGMSGLELQRKLTESGTAFPLYLSVRTATALRRSRRYDPERRIFCASRSANAL